MAWEIVRQESPEDPGNRSRLWDPDDIYEAFKNDKVSEAIRSIQINLLTLKGKKLAPHIPKMSRLRFVEIHGEEDDHAYYGKFRAEEQGLQFSATEIRFLFWKCYALKSLPDIFSFEKIVILKLELGRTEKLWDGVQNLVNLKELDLTGSRSLKELPDLSKAKYIEVLCLGSCSGLTRLPSSFANHTQLLYLDISHCPEILTIPELPLSLESLYAGSCISLKTVFFHSTVVEQSKKNRKQVSFDNCMNLDEPSLEAIWLNARINVMKFAYQHLSAAKQDDFQNYNDYDKNYDSYQAFYGYPGSSVPEWLEYKSRKYSVIIDLSSAPPSPVYGFILCFVLLGELDKLKVNIVISDCEGKGVMDRVRVKLNCKFRNTFVNKWSSFESQKVVVMYDQKCSNFLNNIAKSLTRFKIMVRTATKDDGSFYSKRIMVGLSGFGLKTPTNEGCVPSPACQTAETIGYILQAFDVNKINAFVDDKLEKGEELWPSLVEAIEGSSISLIIFSPYYASSPWCLKELVSILQCKEKYGHTVIPVFYHVKPTDVRHQSSDGYRKAFANHERKHKNEVQLWRDVFEKNDADLLKAIVDLVLRRLSKSQITTGYLKYLLKDGERDNSMVVSLERLKDKALITFSKDNVVSMHDSIKEMAWEIVRQESPEDPGNRSRLWDPDDIYEALKNDKVSEATRSIQIDLETLKKQKLMPHIFSKMSKLRFMEIYGEDKYNCYNKFSGEKLVILKLGGVEKLWDGVKNLVNLKELDLRNSRNLKQLPDLSKASNIEVLCLTGCLSLTSVHPSVFSLTKHEILNLDGCKSLTILATHLHLCRLRYLNLNDCYNLTEFTLTSDNIKQLSLELTRMKALPSSFGHQRKLEFLCASLEQIKENRRLVSFVNSMKLDEPSLEAIGLNARINVMKFANQHLSAPKQDDFQNYNDYEKNFYSYQAFYGYPGSRVPEWLEYKSAKYSVIIDLSSAPPSPGKGITDRVRMKLNHEYGSVISHKVVVMYDQRCSDFLNNIATTRFKIMVTGRPRKDLLALIHLNGFRGEIE
ncbi:hypothetical protein LR48_Vigan04g002700 [Vigna angularis]|uniref:TIR domain-containing protein n=1 Tax=Phaseolus angularis TaxID=3914 RepID=A0A0L9UBB3_PHAAN|nr:hypothetical protein LR48_Vigan04g002700 [Vigna angularis]